MAYGQILDSVLWYTRVRNILYVVYSYLTYVNVKVYGKTEMQLIGTAQNIPYALPVHFQITRKMHFLYIALDCVMCCRFSILKHVYAQTEPNAYHRWPSICTCCSSLEVNYR